MKKTLLILLLFLSVSSFTFAQKSIFIPSRVGVSAGIYSSNIAFEHNYGSGLNDFLFTSGYTFGLQADWLIKKNHSISIELAYSSQGQKHEDWKVPDDAYYYFQRTIRLNYFRLPISYKRVYSKNHGKIKLFYTAGIYLSMLQDAELTYTRRDALVDFVTAMTEKNEYADQITQPDHFTDLFQPIDAGIVLSWGIQYRIEEKIKLTSAVRWELGMLDINDKDWRFPSKNFGYRGSVNSLLGIKLGLLYEL